MNRATRRACCSLALLAWTSTGSSAATAASTTASSSSAAFVRSSNIARTAFRQHSKSAAILTNGRRTMSTAAEATASGGATETAEESETLDVARNLQAVQERIQAACLEAGRSPETVRLVAVSKTKPIELLQKAYDAGQTVLGENYAQELVEKIPQLPGDVTWHFIGALQSNKANMLVNSVAPDVSRLVIETVASTKLANKLNNAVPDEADDKLAVFVQVNTSGEDSKSGLEPGQECVDLCRHIATNCPKLELRGVMTIGAVGDASCFDCLVQCRDAVAAELGLPGLEVSMGMSGDFEAAIAKGSTNVRVGSTIFGAREYPNKK